MAYVAAEESMRRNPREHLLIAREVAEHGVAEDRLAVAGVVAGRRAVLGAWRGQIHELVWRRHRQRAQQDLLVQREDGSIRANPQAEREHRHGRDERHLQEHPKRKRDLTHRRDSVAHVDDTPASEVGRRSRERRAFKA
jgi:hypothetical protein